ncbi:MAG: hypothetical protein V1926_06410 [Candidatus Peregrinibacteria bacterium]
MKNIHHPLLVATLLVCLSLVTVAGVSALTGALVAQIPRDTVRCGTTAACPRSLCSKGRCLGCTTNSECAFGGQVCRRNECRFMCSADQACVNYGRLTGMSLNKCVGGFCDWSDAGGGTGIGDETGGGGDGGNGNGDDGGGDLPDDEQADVPCAEEAGEVESAQSSVEEALSDRDAAIESRDEAKAAYAEAKDAYVSARNAYTEAKKSLKDAKSALRACQAE